MIEFTGQALAQGRHVEAHLHQQGLDRSALLVEQGQYQVYGFNGGMVMANCQGLGIGERQLQLAGQTVYSHGFVLSSGSGRRNDGARYEKPAGMKLR
ncbi:hypothetical protein FQZ97_469540 [compost metagenome]